MARARRVWQGPPDVRKLTAPVAELRPHPRNPRRGNVAEIRKSLERFGQQRPILAIPDGTIVAGHHVFYAAQDLGWTHIAVVRSDLSDAEIDAYLVADNRLSEIGSTDDSMLALLLRPLHDAGRLEGTGYDAASYEQLEERLAARLLADEPEPDPEPAPRPTRSPVDVEEIVLAYDREDAGRLTRAEKVLRKEWGTGGISETVLKALTDAATAARS